MASNCRVGNCQKSNFVLTLLTQWSTYQVQTYYKGMSACYKMRSTSKVHRWSGYRGSPLCKTYGTFQFHDNVVYSVRWSNYKGGQLYRFHCTSHWLWDKTLREGTIYCLHKWIKWFILHVLHTRTYIIDFNCTFKFNKYWSLGDFLLSLLVEQQELTGIRTGLQYGIQRSHPQQYWRLVQPSWLTQQSKTRVLYSNKPVNSLNMRTISKNNNQLIRNDSTYYSTYYTINNKQISIVTQHILSTITNSQNSTFNNYIIN